MKKKVTIISVVILIIVLIIVGIVLYTKNNTKTEKFYLEDKYYGQNSFIEVSKKDFGKYKNESYVLYVYNNYCNLPIPCHDIFENYMKQENIAFLSMTYADFKKIKLHDTVEYAPSVIIVKDGKIISYLDAEKDSDLNKYQDVKEFGKWIEKYIKLK